MTIKCQLRKRGTALLHSANIDGVYELQTHLNSSIEALAMLSNEYYCNFLVKEVAWILLKCTELSTMRL